MKRQEFQDLGIGSKGAEQQGRLLNRNGTFNAERRGLGFFQSLNVYHSLLTMSWWRFNAIILSCYIVVNLFFAGIYLLVGVDSLDGVRSTSLSGKFLAAYFFSTQTFTTVGYGHMSPVGLAANIVASIESLTGLLAFAVATGMLFGRFSRPQARLLFSTTALVAPYQDITGFMFRTANSQKSQMIEVHAEVTFSILETKDGKSTRKYYPLDLERKSVNFFHLSWTVVHPIDESSPMYGLTADHLRNGRAEFVILITAFDDTFSQTVHTRTSYTGMEVEFGKKFATIIYPIEDGRAAIDMHRISETVPA